jgi:S-(hydroxymethyl)mycothiol dehydrogenase
VKVRLVATGICHSDISYLKGEWAPAPCPVVAGHEGAGIVEEVGEDVTLVKPGDHVVVSMLRSCRRCFYCTSGQPHLCRGFPAALERTHLHTKDGGDVTQGLHTAAFAEHSVVDQSQLVPIPDSVPLESAALLACCVITGLGAVANTAAVRPGDGVVVIGTGGVGLCTIQGAHLAGAGRIIALDVLESKLEAARAFGATDAFSAAREDLRNEVYGLTEGLGADYVFVTVGSTAAAAQGLTLLRPGGALVMVGLPRADARLAISPTLLALNSQRILTTYFGATNLGVDVPRYVDLYRQGRLRLDELITKRYPPEEINEAIAAVERGEALRNVIMW